MIKSRKIRGYLNFDCSSILIDFVVYIVFLCNRAEFFGVLENEEIGGFKNNYLVSCKINA